MFLRQIEEKQKRQQEAMMAREAQKALSERQIQNGETITIGIHRCPKHLHNRLQALAKREGSKSSIREVAIRILEVGLPILEEEKRRESV